MAVWTRRPSEGINDIVASRFTRTDGWQDPFPIDALDGTAPTAAPPIVFDGSDFVVAWTQEDVDATRDVYVNRFSGGAWGAATLVSDGTTAADLSVMPAMDVDAAGNAIVIWKSASGTSSLYDLMRARFVKAEGEWSPPSNEPQATVRGPAWLDLGGASNGIFAAFWRDEEILVPAPTVDFNVMQFR